MTDGSRPVIVVGAGPVGLTTALGLTHYRVPVVVLEEDESLSFDTKAGTTLSSTLEVWDRYGVVDEVLARSIRVDEIGDLDRATGQTQRSIKTWLLDRETRFPFVVNIPQHFLEPVLADALERRAPGTLWMAHRLVDFEDHDDCVVIRAEGPHGYVELEADYLLACDGGRSEIRRSLGIEVQGTTLRERYALVDIAVDLDIANPRDYPYLSYFSDPDEWMILIRQPEFWRFVYPRRPDKPERSGEELAAKAKQFIGDVGGMEVVGSYEYTVHSRVAERWRVGRAFLMGDAAHLITPMWALGLNTGVLDASNLPWRIAWARRGWADPSILDGYEVEQAMLAQHGSAAMADAARQYMARQSETLEAMSGDDWANAMTRTLLGVRLDVDGSGDWGITVSESTPAPIRPGDRAPDMPLRGDAGVLSVHQLVAERFAALYFTDVRRRPEIPASTPRMGHFAVSRWDAPPDSKLRGRALFDVGGLVAQRFGCPADTVVVVRPDGYVARVEPRSPGVAEKVYRSVTGRSSAGEDDI